VYYAKYNKTHEDKIKKEEVDLNTALCISIPLFFFFVFVLIKFYRKQKHHLINYRPLLLCKLTGLCSAIYCIALPILLSFQGKAKFQTTDAKHDPVMLSSCLLTLCFTNIFAPLSMMSNLSRYVKLYLLNRRDVGKMKLYNDSSAYPGDKNVNSNFEPNAYLRRINTLVSKQITFAIFVIPYTLLVILGIIFIYKFSDQCVDNAVTLYLPIMILASITGLIQPFIFIKLYKSLNFINKLDMVLNFASLIIGSLLFVSTLFIINGNRTMVDLKSSSLFFVIPSFVSCICANCIPLIEVAIADSKIKQKQLLSKKEFTKLLMGSRYIESLKSCAVSYYCVETVLFWELHMKLMKLVNSHKIKEKNNRNERLRQDSKSGSMQCNNISSPIPTNYDLLLGLNKNIFGSNNNAILYTGCYSESIDPSLVDAMANGSELSPSSTQFSNRSRGLSAGESNQRSRSDTCPSITVVSNASLPVSPINPINEFGFNRQRNDSIQSQITSSSLNNQHFNNNNNNNNNN